MCSQPVEGKLSESCDLLSISTDCEPMQTPAEAGKVEAEGIEPFLLDIVFP